MKNSKKRFWPLLPLIIWICIFPVVAGVVSWATGIHDLWLLVLIDIITIFDLVWYCMTCTRNNETGAINKIGNWIVLDFPAVFMINHWYRIKKIANQKANEKNLAYVKRTEAETVDQKDEEDWDVNLADWEKEILKKRNPKKYDQYVNQEHAAAIVDYKIQEERKIIRGLSVFTMYQIYIKDPEIVNTYKIIQLYKGRIEDDDYRNKLIKEFVDTPDLITFIEDYNPKTMNKKMMSDVLVKTNPAEYEVAFKQDRVQIMIDAKDNWFDRIKDKSIGTKNSTKRIGSSKTSTKRISSKVSNKKSAK